MRFISVYWLTGFLVLTGCAPKVRTTLTQGLTATTVSPTAPFRVFNKEDWRPKAAQVLGTVKISDTGFSFNCTYPEVLKKAEMATRNAGGNAIHIRQHFGPDLSSTCHRIEAVMLLLPDSLLTQKKNAVHPDLPAIVARQKFRYDSLVAAAPGKTDTIFIEERPHFPGGDAAMFQYLAKAVRYPSTAFKDNISGLVIASFVVDEKGQISNPQIIKSVREDLDQETIRIIMAMPPWIPGFQNGKPVRVKYNLPMRYSTGRSGKKNR